MFFCCYHFCGAIPVVPLKNHHRTTDTERYVYALRGQKYKAITVALSVNEKVIDISGLTHGW
jgi:hypothetical protein